tara:strand:+ start:3819 stop:4244 length:426 start_codon:yes stop_codon:yes gene_type:complete
MSNSTYEQRLAVWSTFRNELESSKTPLQDVIEFYKSIPIVSIYTDPWDKETWPTPWELVNENQYCEFCRVLGYCFSLQLTERFNDAQFEIHISTSEALVYYYLLYVNKEYVLGYDSNNVVSIDALPSELEPQVVYQMTNIK